MHTRTHTQRHAHTYPLVSWYGHRCIDTCKQAFQLHLEGRMFEVNNVTSHFQAGSENKEPAGVQIKAA